MNTVENAAGRTEFSVFSGCSSGGPVVRFFILLVLGFAAGMIVNGINGFDFSTNARLYAEEYFSPCFSRGMSARQAFASLISFSTRDGAFILIALIAGLSYVGTPLLEALILFRGFRFGMLTGLCAVGIADGSFAVFCRHPLLSAVSAAAEYLGGTLIIIVLCWAAVCTSEHFRTIRLSGSKIIFSTAFLSFILSFVIGFGGDIVLNFFHAITLSLTERL